MSQPISYAPARAPLPDHEQKQAALSYLNEAWAEARHDGVDGDCLAQASLFAAFAELVGTYGEDAVAKFVEGLPVRVRNGAPVAGAASSPCHITRRPRTKVPTGQPVTRMPS